jgi:hypothetical protein
MGDQGITLWMFLGWLVAILGVAVIAVPGQGSGGLVIFTIGAVVVIRSIGVRWWNHG